MKVGAGKNEEIYCVCKNDAWGHNKGDDAPS